MQSKKWILLNESSDEERRPLFPYGELLSHLLYQRGVRTPEEAEKFLNPSYERDLHDPFRMLNMDKAVDRIVRAMSTGEKIAIYGDYDCDGIPGSVILHDSFKKLGYNNFLVYIPHRHGEGYGLNIKAVESLARDGVNLIITVDCGITDLLEVDRANELGVDVIITDHHIPPVEMPRAYAILNSKQAGETYPFDTLCGAGVAFKLAQAVVSKQNSGFNNWTKWLLDLVGISTIADMVPLLGENRALAYFGLKVLRRSPRPGLAKLLSRARVMQSELTEENIGFTIAPRINAASRMSVPMRGFELLSTNDEVEAGMLADHLEGKNNERRRLVTKIMRLVEQKFEQGVTQPVIVVGDRSWFPGVAGLVASRIVERWHRPAFVWGGSESGELKGSCRSDGSVNLVELMNLPDKKIFIDTGGHALAGGFSILQENVDALQDELNRAYERLRVEGPSFGEFVADKKILLDDVRLDTCHQIERLAPFGMGNKRPIFLFDGLEIAGVDFFGSERDHLRLIFEKGDGELISAVLFNYRDRIDFDFMAGDHIDLLANLEVDNFGRKMRPRLRILDLRPTIW